MLELHGTGFGWVVANGSRYDHDLIITTSGEIIPRLKQLSKKYGGWHTVLGPEELARALEGNPEILLVGCGQFNLLPILDETKALLARRGVKLETMRTSRALWRYEELQKQGKRVAAILHVTC